MKKLIIVKGVANVGKTDTLNALIKTLLANCHILIYPATEEDIVSFAICRKDGRSVGIITFGDPSTKDDVQACLDKCLDYGCDTIFAASRTSGAVYNQLYHFATTKGYVTIETSPLVSYQYRATGVDIATLHVLFSEMLEKLI